MIHRNRKGTVDWKKTSATFIGIALAAFFSKVIALVFASTTVQDAMVYVGESFVTWFQILITASVGAFLNHHSK